jgi:two-component system sensor histidine kinase QseC
MVMVRSRFFRGRHKSNSGSGLGLSIVELALEKIGGSLTLQNRKGDSGLRATVSLPYRAVS